MISACLTWLTDDDVIGHGRAMLVAGDALIHALVRLGLLSADVNDQSAWAGLHNNFRILFHIEMSAVACPWKARVKTENPLGEHCTQWLYNQYFLFITTLIVPHLSIKVVCIKNSSPKKFPPSHTRSDLYYYFLFYVKHKRRYLAECPSCLFPYKKTW